MKIKYFYARYDERLKKRPNNLGKLLKPLREVDGRGAAYLAECQSF